MSALDACLLLMRVDAEVRRRVEVQGLSLSDLAALSHLLAAPGVTLRRQDLADRLGMTPSGITRLLAPLEKLGYVTRTADPRDARLALVTLTEAGTDRTRDALADAEERAQDFLDRSLTTEQQSAMADLLATVVPRP